MLEPAGRHLGRLSPIHVQTLVLHGAGESNFSAHSGHGVSVEAAEDLLEDGGGSRQVHERGPLDPCALLPRDGGRPVAVPVW